MVMAAKIAAAEQAVAEPRVPSGYKRTEVGVIPEDWHFPNFIEFGQIIDGDRGANYPSNNELKDAGYCLFLNAGNVTKSGFRFKKCEFVSEDKDSKLSKGKLNRGDIVLTTRGTLGNFAYYNELVPFEHIRINSGMVILRNASRGIDTEFVYSVLNSSITSAQIERLSFGSAQPQLTVKGLNTLKLPLPPTKIEQEAIADALSDVDALISSLENLIAKKRHIKQGAMQELLRPKEGWVDKNLGKAATLKARIGWQGLTTSEYLKSGDYYLVTGTDFKAGLIDWKNCHYVEENRYRQDKNIQLKKDDVLVTKDGTIGKVAFIDQLSKPTTLNSGVFVIRPIGEAFYSRFFYYVLNSTVFAEFLSQLSAGSTINHLYQKDFVNFSFKTPRTIDKQKEIATVLSDVDAEISALELKLAKARQLKQGMMAELLTGRIRLV